MEHPVHLTKTVVIAVFQMAEHLLHKNENDICVN